MMSLRLHVFATLCFLFSCTSQSLLKDEAINVLYPEVMAEADWALQQAPETITSFESDRSAGGINDFYSEGDYWWPDPDNPQGPYIRRDGLSNPDNFTEHRMAMIRLSQIMGALASAYYLTKDIKYVKAAEPHLKAWFINTKTKMNPSLLYAQAIHGRETGRGIGIIDTIHLMEVTQGTRLLASEGKLSKDILDGVKDWFSAYILWLNSHEYGIQEMNAANNHGTCWVMQVAAFAKLTEDQKMLEFCRNRYTDVLLPSQMAPNGSFPLELSRTKPFGCSLFNLDAMTTICQILSDREVNLWEFTLEDGRSIRKGIDFIFPFIEDKSIWPYDEDIMYADELPIAHPFLFFGALAYNEAYLLNSWRYLEHYPINDEVIRNLPVRNPLIWISESSGKKVIQ